MGAWQANAHSAIFLRLIRAIISTEHLEEINDAALDVLADGLGVTRAAILLFDGHGVMRFSAWRGLSDGYRRAVDGHTPWKPGARLAEPVVVPDVAKDRDLAPYLPVFAAERIGAMAFIPIEGAGGAIGMFMLCYDEPRQLSTEELEAAAIISAQVAFAVERSRAFAGVAEAASAEALEHRSSRYLAAIVESSDDAIVSKSLDGVITSWNRGAELMFGYTAAEAIGRSITLIIPKERLSEEDQLLANVRAGRSVEMETVRRRKDGMDIDISLKVSPVKDVDGRIIGASKIARDITARKRIEADRAELFRRLTMLVAASASLLDSPQTEAVRSATLSLARQLLVADGYAMWEHGSDSLSWRIARSEGISQAFADRVIPSNRPGMAAGAAFLSDPLAVEDVESYSFDPEQLAAYRQEGIRSILVCPMRAGAERAGTLAFYYRRHHPFSEVDVQSAQALANLSAVALTTATLYEEQQAQTAAAELAHQEAHNANRLKDEFLATLSHELRTPLNAILGYAQMLSMGMLAGERQANAVTVLARNSESLRQMIDDVLDVSRIIAGKLWLKVRQVELEDIIRNAVATTQPAADARGVSLQFTVGAGVGPVLCDPDRMQQVIWNLLSNAVKFSGRGGHVQVRLEQAASWVQIVVTDDGEGIDLAFLPHIFERFRQEDSRFSREHGGLGLGLAIVRDLVELHGGTVSASSAGRGAGARFIVRLPPMLSRFESAQLERQQRAIPAPTSAEIPGRLKGARILAVDDEEDARGLLRAILESAGADVTTAGSANRALELLRGERYDAMIADIGMPRMDGLEMIRHVRGSLPAPANCMPAAALTAYARSEDRVTALASGFQMHIAKPVNPAELVTAVAALLGR